jgi:hypothetical protein
MRPQAQENKVDYSTTCCIIFRHELTGMGAGRPEPPAQYSLSRHDVE